jgi:cobalt-zinc-cadmium efflux system protein
MPDPHDHSGHSHDEDLGDHADDESGHAHPQARGSHANHGHSHDHSHGHAHHHADPQSGGRAFVVAIALNTAFVAVEFGFGLLANSTALLADAGHNLSDVLGLVMAWAAVLMSRRTPDLRFTYGLRSSSILAALGNAIFLLVACGAIAWEAVQRFSHPEPIVSGTVMLVAAAGIVVNGVSAWMFMRGSQNDMNVRGAYLHMAGDAAVSLGVVVAGAAIYYTGWLWLDPAVSLVIVLLIVATTWGLLRESLQLSLSGVPRHVDVAAVQAYLQKVPGVASIHDLHIWGISTTETALTVHLVTPGGYPGDAAMDMVTATLRERFGIQHSTLQVEQGTTPHHCVLH